jgi:hypothetical protein
MDVPESPNKVWDKLRLSKTNTESECDDLSKKRVHFDPNDDSNFDGGQGLTVHVFENQRRTPIPPFDWCKKAGTRPDFSDLKFKTGYSID